MARHMRGFLSIVIILTILTPAQALAAGIPCDGNHDDKLTKAELVTGITSYMAGDDSVNLADVQDAAHVYVYWDGEPLKFNDTANYPVIIYRPVKRVVDVEGSYGSMSVLALGAGEQLVGVTDYAKEPAELKALLADTPTVGGSSKPDTEKILLLSPDLVHGYTIYDLSSQRTVLSGAGIPVVQLDLYKPEIFEREMTLWGRILGKEENATALINFEKKYAELISSRVGKLNTSDKPRVYLESYSDYQGVGTGSSNHDTVVQCGGINVYDDLKGTVVVNSEDVIKRNPDIIIKLVSKNSLNESGYGVQNSSQMRELRQKLMSRPGWDNINAVRDGKVYIITTDAKSTHSCVYSCYFAKIIHPELFRDINPDHVHAEWLKRFLGIEFSGIYAYPV